MTEHGDFKNSAEKLWFPEGPVALPEGCVSVMEVLRGTLSDTGRLVSVRWPVPGLRLN